MGSELLKEESDSQKRSFTEIFDKLFPSYLAIGMTYDQFFNDDVYLVRYYEEAEKIRNKRNNEKMWLQGLYIYNAFSVVHYNLNRKKGQQTIEYPNSPYNLFNNDTNINHDEEIAEAKAKSKVWLMNFVNAHKK